MKHWICILCFIILPLGADQNEDPFDSHSRIQLSGLIQPEERMELEELPLWFKGQFPFSLSEREGITLLFFLEDTHPLYRSEKLLFLDFLTRWDEDQLRGFIVSPSGEGDLRDSRDHCARLLGFETLPGVAVFKGTHLVAWNQGIYIDWKNPELELALREILLNP